MSTKRAVLIASKDYHLLSTQHQQSNYKNSAGFCNDQFNSINLNHNYSNETIAAVAKVVQSKSNIFTQNNGKVNFVNHNNDYEKNQNASKLWRKNDLTANPSSHLHSQNYFLQQDRQSNNILGVENLNKSTLSLHIEAYENDAIEAKKCDNKNVDEKVDFKKSNQNETCKKNATTIQDLFSFSPRQQQKEEEELKEAEVMAFKLSNTLFNVYGMKHKHMIQRSKLSPINQFRCYAERMIYQKPEAQSPELKYNIGESEFVNKILKNFPDKVKYLNSILKDNEERRRERSKTLINERIELIKLFQDKLCTSNAKLIPVGSSVSGMLVDSRSDIDLCLYTENLEFYKDFHRHRNLRIYMFNQIRRLVYELRDHDPELQVMDSVALYDTKVPIQIFTFRKGLSMDIQVPREDFQAIRNTNLVKHYLLADERFLFVYLYIKKLFEVLGLRNSKGGLLSSYHLMMLTIHFLQCRSMTKPVLPALCSIIPHRVGPDVPLDKVLKLNDGEFDGYQLEWQSKNTQSPAELIFEMINYYQNFFDVNSHQIYISRGLAIRRLQNKNISPVLQIFDPYSPHSICTSPYISDAFATGIRYIYRCMSYGKLIDSFPHFNDVKGFSRYIEDKPWTFKVKCQ